MTNFAMRAATWRIR